MKIRSLKIKYLLEAMTVVAVAAGAAGVVVGDAAAADVAVVFVVVAAAWSAVVAVVGGCRCRAGGQRLGVAGTRTQAAAYHNLHK